MNLFCGPMNLVKIEREYREFDGRDGKHYKNIEVTFVHNYNKKVDGEWKNESRFIRSTIWGDNAEFINNSNIKPGMKLLIVGKFDVIWKEGYTNRNGEEIPTKAYDTLTVDYIGLMPSKNVKVYYERVETNSKKQSQSKQETKTFQENKTKQVPTQETKQIMQEPDIFEDIFDEKKENKTEHNLDDIFGDSEDTFVNDDDIFSESSTSQVIDEFDVFE